MLNTQSLSMQHGRLIAVSLRPTPMHHYDNIPSSRLGLNIV